jgi:hypothetical protein
VEVAYIGQDLFLDRLRKSLIELDRPGQASQILSREDRPEDDALLRHRPQTQRVDENIVGGGVPRGDQGANQLVDHHLTLIGRAWSSA